MSLAYFSERFGSVMGSIPDNISATIPVPTGRGVAVVYYQFVDEASTSLNHDITLITAAIINGGIEAAEIPINKLFTPPLNMQGIPRTGNDAFWLAYKKKQACCKRLVELIEAGLYSEDGELCVSAQNADGVKSYINDVRSLSEVTGLQALYDLLIHDLVTSLDRI